MKAKIYKKGNRWILEYPSVRHPVIKVVEFTAWKYAIGLVNSLIQLRNNRDITF